MGTAAVDLQLAGPATGPVTRVWYSADGSALYARTESAQVFRTADFDAWTPAASDAANDAAPPVAASAVHIPESGARVLGSTPGSERIFAVGRQLWGSGDGGQTWLNLTSYRAAAVVGSGRYSVAVSPNDDRQIVLANDFGVWRSMDGGLSWDGLNRNLPNLKVLRILSTPSGAAGTRIHTDGLGELQLAPGSAIWEQTAAPDLVAETRAMQNYSRLIGGVTILSMAASGNTVYAGSADGRVFLSLDGGRTFPSSLAAVVGDGRVQRIYVDPLDSSKALAVLDGKGPHVWRTTSQGSFWTSLDGEGLPNVAVYGVTADRLAGAVYVATAEGVFYAHTDLQEPDSNPVAWENLSKSLPAGAATAEAYDVRLDPAGVQLYAAVDGYGVFATPAPHRLRSLRIVNTADYSTRPAAPGSLLSVVGGRVYAVTGENLSYPVLQAAESESQIQVPFEAVGPNVALQLQTSGGSLTRGVVVQPVSPAVLVGRDGVPMLWDADTGLPIDARNAAHSNGRMQIWATGLGKVHPDWPTGLAAPMENPPEVAAQVHAYLDGQELQVTKATLVPGYVGFYLVEVQLPPVNNLGPSALWISAGGQESNRVQVILEP